MQLVNGQPVSHVSVQDRSVLYGHGVFETVLVVARQPRLWNRHIDRLTRGCIALGLPFDANALEQDVRRLCQDSELDNFVLRINQTMGEGGRGYANPETPTGNRIVSIHETPNHDQALWRDGINLGVCELRLSSQPALAGIKHNNRLEQILARASWQAGWHEALLLDQNERVIEATQSNLFLVMDDGLLVTPDLSRCGVAGVMRDYILTEVASQLELHSETRDVSLEDVNNATELFVSNSVIGVWPVKQWETTRYHNHPVTHQILSYLTEHEVISPN
jgi:4-amino-4-deoxychorismate lyase